MIAPRCCRDVLRGAILPCSQVFLLTVFLNAFTCNNANAFTCNNANAFARTPTNSAHNNHRRRNRSGSFRRWNRVAGLLNQNKITKSGFAAENANSKSEDPVL